MKKLLLLLGTVLLLWIPGFEIAAQSEVSREMAITSIQTPIEGDALSDEEAEALLVELEAAILEAGSISSDDAWILPEYLPESLNLDHGTHVAILSYLESYALAQAETVDESQIDSLEESEEELVDASEETADAESEENEESEAETEDIDPLEKYPEYRMVINDYYTAIMTYDSEAPHLIPEQLNVRAVELVRDIDIDRMIYFAVVDLDNNGTDELVLTSGDQMFEVYTTDIEVDERVAIPLFENNDLVERSHLRLYEEGTMIIQAIGGNDYGSYTLYEMTDDGLDNEAKDAMIYDLVGMPEETPYYREEDDSVNYSQEEFEAQLGLDSLVEVNPENLDWYPVVDPADLEEVIAQEEVEQTPELDENQYPYAVDYAALGEWIAFTLDAMNAPTQMELDLVNHQLTMSANGNNVNSYQISFSYIDTTNIRVFSNSNPGEIRTVSVNSAITINEILQGSQSELVGQTFYLFYNSRGGISLATTNVAGNVEADQTDVMLEYVY